MSLRSGRSVAWRLLALTLALGGAAGPIVTQAHLAEVRHLACADHGGWVHAGESSGEGRRTRNDLLQAASGTEHGHEHCQAAPSRRDVRSAGDDLDTPRAPHHRTVLLQPGLLHPPARARRYAFAPKQSPPA